MSDNTRITRQDIDNVSVRLHPILGVEPRVYVVVLFGLAVLAALFLLFFFPGLRNPGASYEFTVDPPGSAIVIDGAYAGSAPCRLFVPAGRHDVRIERPGFNSHASVIVSRGRVFGTLFYKPAAEFKTALEPVDARSVLSTGVASYASWALAGSPSEYYQIPMVLSDAARAAMIQPEAKRPAGLAGAVSSYAVHSQSMRDA
ncbi:MAG: PEGA domain-containing protein, partial [Spirochaetales bacterium]|nr:PEGA domain-containing protein [Spirochaetales bacterium]